MRNAQQSVHLVAASVGFASFALLWLSVLWGTTLRMGWGLTRIRHHTLYGVHQTLTTTGLTLGVVHALAQLAVPAGTVGWAAEVVPGIDRHDRIGVGAGVVALEVMLAIAASILVQRRMGYHRWRHLHSLAYLAFTLLGAHVLISGSDTGGTGVRAGVAAAWAVTVLARLATSRLLAALPRALARRVAGRLRGRDVTVSVDPSRCVRFGFCEQEAPGVFTLRADGRLAYRASVPVEEVEPVIAAARVCPARAVVLGRLATRVVMPGTPPAGTPGGVPGAPPPTGGDPSLTGTHPRRTR